MHACYQEQKWCLDSGYALPKNEFDVFDYRLAFEGKLKAATSAVQDFRCRYLTYDRPYYSLDSLFLD